MAKVKIRNVCALGELVVPLLGGRLVPAGEEIQVPADIAGAPPAGWRPATARENVTDFPASRPTADGSDLEVLDLGSGLLAQPDNWQPADASPADGGDA